MTDVITGDAIIITLIVIIMNKNDDDDGVDNNNNTITIIIIMSHRYHSTSLPANTRRKQGCMGPKIQKHEDLFRFDLIFQ